MQSQKVEAVENNQDGTNTTVQEPIATQAPDFTTSSTKLQLVHTESALVVGQKYILQWSLLPTEATDPVSFSSDNESVATVDSKGEVTGVRVGTATISVFLANGEKANCVITVSSLLESIQVLYLSKNTCTLAVNQSRTVYYELVPEGNPETKMLWTTSDEQIATVEEDGRVTAKKVGTVQITMEADDGSGIKTSITVKVKKRDKSGKLSESNLSIVDDSKVKYTYNAMVSDLKALNNKYGDCIDINILNLTYDKRNIYEVVLGNPNAKKHIVVQSTIHGREYMASLLTMKQIELYCRNYYTGMHNKQYFSEYFDDVAFHIVPMANPDGVTISQSGASGIRNKTLRKKLVKMCKKYGKGKKSYYTRWKANARGVDLNRNFNSYWKILSNGIKSPGAYFYKGKTVESEIETETLVNLVNEVKPICTISYHASGSVLYWYYGQKGSLKTKSVKLVSAVKKLTGYDKITSFTKKKSAGFSDWISIKKKLPAVTIEIGKKSCPLKLKEFKSIWKKNKMLYITVADLYDIE